MSEIKIGDTRIGSVTKFVGNPPAKRWVAVSIHQSQPDVENKRGFPTRKTASDWLVEEHASKKRKSDSAEGEASPTEKII